MKILNFFKKHYYLFFLLLLAILAGRPLFQAGYFSYHDYQHLARFAELDKAIKSGHFPVRWSENLGFGYGYPIFVFYPPLIYYLAEIFHLIGFSFIVSFKMMLFLGFLLSAYFMYLLVKELLGKHAGFLSSALYLFVPYRAVTIYVRGAMAGFFSFVWIPAVFWSLIKFDKTKKRKFLFLSALFTSLVIITHSLIALPFAFFLACFVFYLFFKSEFKNIKEYLIYGLLTLGMSCFFWLPSLALKEYTLVDRILTTELANYKIHFVYPQQLWDSLWAFGGSVEGLLDGMSFKIGKLHIIFAGLSIILLVFANKTKKKIKKYMYIFSIFLIVSIYLTLKISKPVWDIFKPLWYLQFPWRFLLFISLFISILSGFWLTFIKKKKIRILFLILVITLLLQYNLKLFWPQFIFPEKKDADYINQERIKWEVSKSSFEYLPKGVELKIGENNTSTVAISKDEVAKGIGNIVSGKGSVKIVMDKPHNNLLEVKAEEPLVYRFNTTNFIGWKAYLNGKRISIQDDNKLKLITVSVPKGEYRLKLVFKNRIIQMSNYISLLSYLIWGYLFYGLLRNKRIH